LVLIAGKKLTKYFPQRFFARRALEGVAQEVERYVLVLPGPIVVLAVDDPSLRRMKLQTALLEPTTDGLLHRTGLPLAPTVDDGIARITLERDAREGPLHPLIERVVQEEVGQQRADDPALWRAPRARLQRAIRLLHRGESFLEVESHTQCRRHIARILTVWQIQSRRDSH
jgi:hypothetical protein